MLRLVFPNTSHKEEYLSMIEEWKSHELPSSPGALFQWQTFEEFLQLIINAPKKGNRLWVPASLFFLINQENRILWAIHIRHHINHPNLIETWWHIGYGIRPSERWKWYAKQMLKLALLESRKLWLEKVLITCDDDNIASSKVIESNGWIFERYTEIEWEKLRRYWIDLYKEEKELLKSLELELLWYESRHNIDRIDEILADDFFECGKTGMMFGKKECLDWLPQEKTKKLDARDVSIHMLSESLCQVRYIVDIDGDWEDLTSSFRTSLWRKTSNWWQMFFHQGTLIQTKN